MRDEMVDSVKDATFGTLAVEFSKVEFMGTVGFLALMSLRRELPVLCGLSANLKRVVAGCHLTSDSSERPAVFKVAETVEDIEI